MKQLATPSQGLGQLSRVPNGPIGAYSPLSQNSTTLKLLFHFFSTLLHLLLAQEQKFQSSTGHKCTIKLKYEPNNGLNQTAITEKKL